ncbi:Small RNA 2'-O-methyltransferase [Linnemannia gamsii]|uniref:Small RNA 2'-O-methyltransferase n=1 Tax=Linnemannia gamsii TaxID=64522 RepID=A0A9P6QQF7_9FUNG|nr:Small RNA 2'-O-methyltransferase [Linnemannia gamsii]
MYFPPTANSATSSTADSACDADDEPRFYPPLWQQRRNLARRILDENHSTSVIDFGCGEAALMSLLVWETTGDYPITHLAGVELIEDRLQLAREACQPQDFELGSNLRVNKLTIDLYQGSVDQPDQRFIGFDALVCLEVVEHLDPPVLEKFWSVVLGTLKPKLVIVSTPNAEFNIYFPQLNYGKPNAIFRNDDHRFEWTRQEFQDWCNAAAGQYGYNVTYTGAGALPGYNPEVGLCTQFAILHNLNPSQAPEPVSLGANAVDQPYRLFSRVEYPIYKEQHSDSEILEYLHEKIALVRPRLPEPYDETEETGYYNEASYGHPSGGHGENYSLNPSDEPDNNTSSDITPDDPPSDPNIELGVISLEDIWIILGVRQRCKTRAGLMRILNQSSLVRIEQEAGLIRFDEDNPYWKEADRSLEAPLYQDDELSPSRSENDDWSDSSFYKDEQDNFEEEGEVERKPYGLEYQHYIDQEEQVDAPLEESGWSAWHESPVTCSEHSPEWYSPK